MNVYTFLEDKLKTIQNERVKKVCQDILITKFSKTLQDYAAELNITNKYLSDLFTKHVGINFTKLKKQYVKIDIATASDNANINVIIPFNKYEDIIDEHSLKTVAEICKNIFGGIDGYNYQLFETQEVLEKIKEYKCSLNTKQKLVHVICVIMNENAGKMYPQYYLYRQEIEVELLKMRMEKKCPNFTLLYEKSVKILSDINSVFIDHSCGAALIYILALFIKVNYEEPSYNIGILRPSDLIRLKDENINKELNIIHINDKCTKNGVSRDIKVPSEFMKNFILFIPYVRNVQNYSIVDKVFDCTFNDIRSSCFTWRESLADTYEKRQELLILCFNQGHSYSTAMTNYLCE